MVLVLGRREKRKEEKKQKKKALEHLFVYLFQEWFVSRTSRATCFKNR